MGSLPAAAPPASGRMQRSNCFHPVDNKILTAAADLAMLSSQPEMSKKKTSKRPVKALKLSGECRTTPSVQSGMFYCKNPDRCDCKYSDAFQDVVFCYHPNAEGFVKKKK